MPRMPRMPRNLAHVAGLCQPSYYYFPTGDFDFGFVPVLAVVHRRGSHCAGAPAEGSLNHCFESVAKPLYSSLENTYFLTKH